MKWLLLLLFLPFTASSQEYVSASGLFFPNVGNNSFAGGGLLSAGKFISGATIGLGGGVLVFEDTEPYIPVFVDFGYIGNKKINPYFNVKMGWSFFEGSAEFIGEKGSMKGGFFTNLAAGGNYNFAKNFRAALQGGMSAIMLRKKLINKTETFSGSFFNVGVSLIYIR